METICFRMPQSLHIPIAKCVIRQIELQLGASKAGQTCAGSAARLMGSRARRVQLALLSQVQPAPLPWKILLGGKFML